MRLHVVVNGAEWSAADFLAGRAVALLVPRCRARALAELVAVAVALAWLEQGTATEVAA